ncbi:hypothetical protein MMC07_001028 [Pseudocyphellaria aurata]|nr:hypothetical protein [Pseudocyphellaria aurata]
MVLFFPIIAAIPTVIGVSEGISHQRRSNNAASMTEAEKEVEREQMRKFTLKCYCDGKGKRAREIHGGKVVLRGSKVWILPKTIATPVPTTAVSSHPFEGFYIPYPDPDLHPDVLGLVSSISDDPPMLNWIYVDRATRELRYGNRTQSREHVVGSWGWEAGEEGGPGGLTLGDSEGGVAVWQDKGEGEEEVGGWELRWEGDEGIKGGLKVSLDRKWVEEVVVDKVDEENKMEPKAEEKEKKEPGTTFQVTHTTVAATKKKKKRP